ncbi:hypothetical protein B9479_007306 [Cryptococcus floricola]|uniref:Striatin N-terminal domain-containing protein n=1 Tax=Cryptococcus floricola TaxID=2591691 RepID=A0A5D3AN64_9TREE|nr:hypothetical protein B9479_007306 [Cryptococcus floricola]
MIRNHNNTRPKGFDNRPYDPPSVGMQRGSGGLPPGGPGGFQQFQSLQQQQQPQPQQQQQQQQQPQQQQQGPQSTNGTAEGSGSMGAPGQEMNLAGVLHYLQSEWRRWERDRNEWEIERAEMRARIALLEGQRRSAENLKVDLLRRVKMLEFALRQERTKTVSVGSKPHSVPPARLAALQDEDKLSSSEKEGSGSEGSQEDLPKLNGIHPAAIGKSSTIASRSHPLETGQWKGIGAAAAKDPKARARSREYLKQCLQEITYLTSPGALNPLPPHPPVDPSLIPGPDTSDPSNPQPDPFDRPRKEIIEVPSAPFPKPRQEHKESEELPNGEASTQGAQPEEKQISAPIPPRMQEKDNKPPSSPAPKKIGLPDVASETEQSKENQESGFGEQKQLLTAIYRPESKTAWREELRAANEEAEKAKQERKKPEAEDDQLANLTLETDEEVKTDESVDKVWVTKRSLKSHLDIVRAVDFAHGPGIVLATGGDDCTVKVWAVDPASVMSHRPAAQEVDPIQTLRGHTAGITAVTVSSSLSTIFSASLDSTIRLWKLPPHDHDPYAPWNPTTAIQTLVGHTEAVWDICLLPSREIAKLGKEATEARLVSASADGSVKLWQRSGSSSEWKLFKTFNSFGSDAKGTVVPTSLAVYNLDFGKILVGTSDGTVRLWDVDTGEEVQVFGGKEGEGEAAGSQVNAVLSHPTLPAIITGHEDGQLRFYDAKSSSSSPTHTILAHPSPITSLALSPSSPTCILTSSSDCTVRLWDLGKKTSIQELAGHRKRADEGVCAVGSHPELPVVASVGADGVVRLWGSA